MKERYQEDLEGVLSQYPVRVTGIRTESYKEKKGVWWIETPGGYKILKKHSNSDKTLYFIIAAVEYLQSRGILMPGIIPAADGRKYVISDNSCFVLSEAISGVNPSYNSREQLKRVVQELAKLHRASEGFVPPKDSKPRVHIGNCPDTYNARMEKLEGYYALEEGSAGHDEFGEIILEEFPHFLQRIRESIDGFEGSYYRQWFEKAQRNGYLCHQDFAAGNLILTDAGELYVLDIDSITLDLPIRDIRKLLLKVMKKRGGWDLSLTTDMLAWYQQENPLEQQQWQVLKWELMYPHLFEGIMTKYYEKREKTWTVAKYLRRLKEMTAVEKTIGQVLDGFDALIRQQI
ncbi:MAG: CotS family spore coat protein [Bacillota bacterium]|jgi:spore coat-associated protein S|nr:CotS family spore coat protein [Bacillota bacterium]MDD3298400.1 CotS family spore coat protein [Bacillota bacterium]MDD3850622.1 CotS family spore coat protein [Bacillota bacterium]MDD4708149.1 CotS family spore coat protein [Bacillota bacterium]